MCLLLPFDGIHVFSRDVACAELTEEKSRGMVEISLPPLTSSMILDKLREV